MTSKIQTHKLGENNLEVSAIRFSRKGLSSGYGTASDKQEKFNLIWTVFDTAESLPPMRNEGGII